MMSTCSAIVAMTGNAGVRVELGSRMRRSSPTTLRAYSMTMHCRPRQRPEGRDAVLAGELQRAELALDAAHAESAGHADAVEPGQLPGRRPPACSHSSEGIQRMLTLVCWAKPPARSASVTER